MITTLKVIRTIVYVILSAVPIALAFLIELALYPKLTYAKLLETWDVVLEEEQATIPAKCAHCGTTCTGDNTFCFVCKVRRAT